MSKQSDAEAMLGCLGGVGLIVLAIPLGIASSLYSAWVLTHYWEWFVTPAFGLAVPRLWLLAGMIEVVSFLKLGPADWAVVGDESKKMTFGGYVKRYTVAAMLGLMVLLAGLLMHLCAGWFA